MVLLGGLAHGTAVIAVLAAGGLGTGDPCHPGAVAVGSRWVERRLGLRGRDFLACSLLRRRRVLGRLVGRASSRRLVASSPVARCRRVAGVARVAGRLVAVVHRPGQPGSRSRRGCSSCRRSSRSGRPRSARSRRRRSGRPPRTRPSPLRCSRGPLPGSRRRRRRRRRPNVAWCRNKWLRGQGGAAERKNEHEGGAAGHRAGTQSIHHRSATPAPGVR